MSDRYLDELVDSEENIEMQLNDFVAMNSNPMDFDDSMTSNLSVNRQINENSDNNQQEEEGYAIGQDSFGVVSDLRDIDPWDPLFDPKAVFDQKFMTYLTDFFYQNCDQKITENKSKKIKKLDPNSSSTSYSSSLNVGLLSYEKFSQWNDIKQMLREGQVDLSCLLDLWIEAVTEYQWKYETPGKECM